MKDINSAVFMLFDKKTMKPDQYQQALQSPRSPREDEDASPGEETAHEIPKDFGFENGRASKFYFDLMKLVERCYLLFSISGIFLAALGYEIEFKEVPISNPTGMLWICSISTIVLVFMTIVRHRLSLLLSIKRHEELQSSTLLNSSTTLSVLLECLVNIIHPTPFLYGIEMEYISAYDYFRTHYDVNDFFSLLILLRLIYIIKIMVDFTFWNSNSARRICKMYDANPGFFFSVRSLMKSYPLRFVFSIYAITIPLFAYCLRIAERPLSLINTGAIWSYDSYLDSLWNVIITLSTVGYGDYFPRTGIGRFFAFCLCLWGSFIISLMVVAITRFIEMSIIEEKAYSLLKRLQLKTNMKHYASLVITKMVKLKMDYKNKRPKNLQRVNEIRKNLNKLKRESRLYRTIGLNEIGFDTMYRKYVYMREDIFTMIKQTDDLIMINTVIMKALGMGENFIFRKGLQELKDIKQAAQKRFNESSNRSLQALVRVDEEDEISESKGEEED